MDLKKFDRFLAMIQPERNNLPSVKNTNDISDIPGAKPDAFGRLKNIQGRDCNNINDIKGARPMYMERPPPVNKEHYMMLTKDVNEEYKKRYQKDYNPLDPRYILSTKSGRKQIIGIIDDNKPKVHTRRPANADTRRYIRTDDIEGAQPRKQGSRSKNLFNRSKFNNSEEVYNSYNNDTRTPRKPLGEQNLMMKGSINLRK